MKKLAILIAIVFAAHAANAQRGSRSILKIKLTDETPITISIDDRYYRKHGKVLTVGDLPSGRHRLKIYEYSAYRDGEGGHAHTLYSGTIKLQGGMIVSLTYDPDTRDMRVVSNYLDQTYDDNTTTIKGEDDRKDVYNDDVYSKPKEQATAPTVSSGTGRLASEEITDLQAQVADKLTDTDKEKLMKSSLDGRSYTTQQVHKMLGWLSFESSKVDFAKWAYTNVTDRENYPKLERDFAYTSSKEEFNNYLKKQ